MRKLMFAMTLCAPVVALAAPTTYPVPQGPVSVTYVPGIGRVIHVQGFPSSAPDAPMCNTVDIGSDGFLTCDNTGYAIPDLKPADKDRVYKVNDLVRHESYCVSGHTLDRADDVDFADVETYLSMHPANGGCREQLNGGDLAATRGGLTTLTHGAITRRRPLRSTRGGRRALVKRGAP